MGLFVLRVCVPVPLSRQARSPSENLISTVLFKVTSVHQHA